MAEINNDNEIKTIAFYLPQFHTFPENDEWWGKGFTEWTNTKKAKPLYEGHYQPKTPLNENYYDLSDVTVMEKQAEMAKKYGLFGFCYYHYWFKDGKKLLHKPVENMLNNRKVNIPFCLSWANENWSKNWDGGNREVIMKQDYGKKRDWEKHFQYLLQYFKDNRYITYEGKPILVIYKPEEIPVFNDMIDYWQERIKEEGFLGLIILRQYPQSYYDKAVDDSRIDYTVKFEPVAAAMVQLDVKSILDNKLNKRKLVRKIKTFLFSHNMQWLVDKVEISKANRKNHNVELKEFEMYDYDDTWEVILKEEPYGEKLINGAFVAWDNTPRNINGRIYKGAEPEKFENYMTKMLQKKSPLNLVFINAWNEWAEGAYLEPDEKYGYAYLEALKEAVNTVNN